MEPLTPIPTPAAKQFEELRLRFLPWFVLIVCSAIVTGLWRQNVAPSSFVAEVEKVESSVISPDSGFITNVLVRRFESVKAGQVVAEVVSTDPRRLGARMDALRGEMAISTLEVNALVEREKLAFDYESLRLELQKHQLELSVAKATLAPAERDMEIAGDLVKLKIINETEVNYFAKIRDPLKAQVEEQTRIVSELTATLRQKESLGNSTAPAATRVALEGSVRRFEGEREKLLSEQSMPILLKAPIDGVVTSIHHQAGENVMAGDILLTITAKEGRRLIGYVHQPATENPTAGMPVRIRSRSADRLEADSRIAEVASHYEVITNLALVRPGVIHDSGLPLSIDVPEKLRPFLRPGELVEVTFKH